MENEALINLCGRMTLAYLGDKPPELEICGVRLLGIDRDIFRQITIFVFENGWEIPLRLSRIIDEGGPGSIYRALLHEIELRLHIPEPAQLEAFRAPEVLADEDPDESDSDPLYLCEECRRKY